jgi:tRNA nucleotidyltransferase (CCA-adding enzyme)
LDLSGAESAFAEATHTVEPRMSAIRVGSGDVPVLSTPWMIALMENTSKELLQPYLPRGFTSVGTHVDVSHTAPVAIGSLVRIESRVLEVRGGTLTFQVRASHLGVEVGFGTHRRSVLNTERFLAGLKKGTS